MIFYMPRVDDFLEPVMKSKIFLALLMAITASQPVLSEDLTPMSEILRIRNETALQEVKRYFNDAEVWKQIEPMLRKELPNKTDEEVQAMLEMYRKHQKEMAVKDKKQKEADEAMDRRAAQIDPFLNQVSQFSIDIRSLMEQDAREMGNRVFKQEHFGCRLTAAQEFFIGGVDKFIGESMQERISEIRELRDEYVNSNKNYNFNFPERPPLIFDQTKELVANAGHEIARLNKNFNDVCKDVKQREDRDTSNSPAFFRQLQEQKASADRRLSNQARDVAKSMRTNLRMAENLVFLDSIKAPLQKALGK
jgi:hypothetical protein